MYRNILARVVVDAVFGVLGRQLEVVGQVALQLLELVFEFLEGCRRVPWRILTLLPSAR